MSVTLLRGDALRLPLADDSVDLIVTSPPYFGLRSYTDGGEHYAGQIGSEATPGEFLDALVAATAEMVRVLKPSGTIFVNLGDRYDSSANGGPSNSPLLHHGPEKLIGRRGPRRPVYGRPKSLMLIPERYRIRCVDELGLIARAVVIWSKPNGLPESVTDRVRRSHEDWVHLTKEPRYYAAVDEIREAYDGKPQRRGGTDHQVGEYAGRNKQTLRKQWDEPLAGANPLGKLPGSVWTVPTQPLTVPPELGVDHFAAFPMEWPRRLILGWSPPGICLVCGEGRRPVVLGEDVVRAQRSETSQAFAARGAAGGRSGFTRDVRWMGERRVSITGYACACPEPTAPTRPAVVLDPFGGTGTTALVADVLGRHGISLDMSRDYLRIAGWRTTDPGQRAAAMHVPKPPPAPPGHDDGDLLSLLDDEPAPEPAAIEDAEICHAVDDRGRRCERWNLAAAHTDLVHQHGRHRWPVVAPAPAQLAPDLTDAAGSAAPALKEAR